MSGNSTTGNPFLAIRFHFSNKTIIIQSNTHFSVIKYSDHINSKEFNITISNLIYPWIP